MKFLVVLMSVLLAVSIVACAPRIPGADPAQNTITQVRPVQTEPTESQSADSVWDGNFWSPM